jgi:hypothetical protein
MTTNERAKLASAVERQAVADGVYDTAVPALRLSQFSAPSDLAAPHSSRSTAITIVSQ